MFRSSPSAFARLLVLLVAASYGGVIPTVTDVSRADAGRLHRCSFDRCGRVERVLFDDPVCSGTPERTHTATVATPIDDDGAVVPTDDRHLFA